MLLWLITAALALPPDGIKALYSIGTGRLENMITSYDGDVVIGTDAGTGTAWLLYVEDWSLNVLEPPCEDLRSTTFIGFEDGYGEWYVGCGNGLIYGYEWVPEESAVYQLLDADGNPFTIDVGDPVDGLWYSPLSDNGTLYTLYGPSTGAVTLHEADSLNGVVDFSEAYPLQLVTHTGYNEGVLLFDDDTLVVHHGSNQLTTIQLSSALTAPSAPQGATLAPVDIYPSFNGGVYAVASTGQMAEFVNSLWTTELAGLNDPKAVVASFDPGDHWIAVTGGDARVWQMDDQTGQIIGDASNPYFVSIPEPGDENWIQDGTASDGYLWGGGTNGFLHIATARPWVDPTALSASPTAGTQGDEITVSFSLAEAGEWEIRRGGDRGRGGDLVASGTVDGPSSLSEKVTIESNWAEGDNALYVFHRDNRNQWGHARLSVFVDNPPGVVKLRPADLEFGDEKLLLSFDNLPDEDLASYDVYVTTIEFDNADYDTGGPIYAGFTELQTPILVTAVAGSDRVTVDINPLTNDVEHYVAVRARDQGGLVGPLSNVISETPRPAFSASDLAGEKGGPRCATTPGSAGWLAVGLAGLVSLRRRSGSCAALVALGLAVAPSALAQEGKKGLEKDLTPQRGDFELRYGGISLDDKNIKDVYRDTQANILQVEFGPQITRFFEVDFGIGFFQELAFKIDGPDGTQSGERTMLTWWPALSLDGSARLHVVDEQIVVPYVRGGFDWIVWSEKWDSGGGKNVLRGDKFGNHYGLGASLLLDVFDKRRASLLEASTGINDTYLTFEWRKQAVDNRDLPWTEKKVKGLNFGATMFTAGLKLDY